MFGIDSTTMVGVHVVPFFSVSILSKIFCATIEKL